MGLVYNDDAGEEEEEAQLSSAQLISAQLIPRREKQTLICRNVRKYNTEDLFLLASEPTWWILCCGCLAYCDIGSHSQKSLEIILHGSKCVGFEEIEDAIILSFSRVPVPVAPLTLDRHPRRTNKYNSAIPAT